MSVLGKASFVLLEYSTVHVLQGVMHHGNTAVTLYDMSQHRKSKTNEWMNILETKGFRVSVSEIERVELIWEYLFFKHTRPHLQIYIIFEKKHFVLWKHCRRLLMCSVYTFDATVGGVEPQLGVWLSVELRSWVAKSRQPCSAETMLLSGDNVICMNSKVSSYRKPTAVYIFEVKRGI